jgi:hypothetical protein
MFFPNTPAPEWRPGAISVILSFTGCHGSAPTLDGPETV